MHWKQIVILIAGLGFCLSLAGYLLVRIFLGPQPGSDWDRYHWEVEEQDRRLARYNRWCSIAFSAVIVSMLALFLALVF